MSNIRDNELIDNLELKVAEFYKDFEPFIKQRLEKLYTSGVGVIDDYKDNGQNWITPRCVFAAIAQEFADQVQFKRDKATDKVVKNYRNFL
jgi:hypothetical protein